ncbi:cation:proton antiporter [Natrialbaceae archaeon GCM10025810]|uniref:cation:proton antiporter n=1 Tax=Halovalidus salilacus TaxID=3075124 RepID=UPI0036141CE3
MATETALFDVGVLFGAVGLAGVIAGRINQSVIPFYIFAGMLLGPHVLGELPSIVGANVGAFGIDVSSALAGIALADTDFVTVGAELGIVLLLFFLGLEFNLERLLASRTLIGKAGLVDLLNFAVGLVLGWLLFGNLLAAFLVAGIVYISSSAIITKSLIDLGWIANDEADPMLGTLVFEDLFIAIYLAIASVLVIGGDDVAETATQIGLATGFIVALLLLVHFGAPLFQRALETDSHEFVVLRVLGVTVLVAGAALSVEVSEAVAAFFVGMAFSSTEHVHRIEELFEPLRDAFAAVFFFWIGLLTDPGVFADAFVLVAIAVSVAVTTPSKFVTGYLGGRIYDLDERRSVRVGLGMTTRGEFSLIIASLALSGAGSGLSDGTADAIYAFAVGYVLFMSILGTTLMQYADDVESVVVPRLKSARGVPRRTDD